jgi:MFS family permease
MSLALGRRIVNFLGLRRSVAAMLTMVILVGMGEKLGERFLPIYILALGGGAYVIGLLNAMDNLLSALYSYPGGYLSDRLGYKRALAVFNLVSMAGYAIVILVPSWQAVILGAIFFISWDALSLPATMSLVATVLPQNKRTMGVSLHSFIRRIPMALGPMIGGLLIARFGERDGVRLAFGLAMILAAVALVFQQLFIRGVRRRVAVDHLAADELSGCDCVRCGRHAVLHPVRPRPAQTRSQSLIPGIHGSTARTHVPT